MTVLFVSLIASIRQSYTRININNGIIYVRIKIAACAKGIERQFVLGIKASMDPTTIIEIMEVSVQISKSLFYLNRHV